MTLKQHLSLPEIFSTAEKGKLGGISTGADVTATVIHAAAAKATPVDADEFGVIDSAASNVLKKSTWANIKTTLAAWLALLPSGTIFAIHNQSDQVTNFERVRIDATSNVFRLWTEAGGTGTIRDLRFGAGSTNYLVSSTAAAAKFLFNVASSSASVIATQVSAALGSASGTQTALKVAPTVSQTSTAGYTGLLVEVVETTTGSGTKRPIDVTVGGASKFSVDNTGIATSAGSVVTTKAVVSLTSSATLAAITGREYIYLLGTGAVPTLPTAVSAASFYVLKNTTASTITVATTSSQTIEGSTTYVLAAGESITVVSDNANWRII